MAVSKLKLKQIENSSIPGSIPGYDASNVLSIIAPTAGADRIPFYDDSATSIAFLTLGTNLSITGTTINATAGAGGYAEIQEEGSALTARTKINFVGSGLTAADDSANARTNVSVAAFLNTLATAGNVNLTSAVAGILPVANGGTGIASGTSGGILAYTAAGTLASSALLTANAIMLGGGAGVVPSTPLGLGTTVQVLHGNAAGAPTWGAVSLTADVTGTLPIGNGGTGTTTGSITGSGALTFTAGGTNTNVVLVPNGTGSVDVSNKKITNLADPTNAQDAVTLSYVQTYVNGLDPKASVRAATTTNGNLATAFANGQIIDGVTLATGNRILIKNQSLSFDNGIYIVNASGAPTRATDMDSWTEVPSTFLFVEIGTANADTGWVCTSDQGGTLGTTAITFVRFASNVSNISGSGSSNTVAYWSAVDTLTYNSNFQFNGTQLSLNTAPVASTFTTLGAGNTNTTFGYKHLASTASEVFSITDNGTLKVTNSSSANTTISPGSISTNSNLTISSTSQIAINPAAGTDVSIGNGGGGIFRVAQGNNYTTTTGTLLASEITPTFVNGVGNTATFSSLEVRPNITQTGGATGITRGISIAPTLTNAFDFRGLEITATSAHYALYTVSGKVRFDLGSDAVGDMYYRDGSGNFVRLATGATSGHVLTSNGSAAAPSWQAASGSGSTITTGYVTGTGTTVYDLDAGIVVTDVDGTAFSFTVPTNLDKVFVYRNGMLLSRSGTVSRDYTLVSATGVLTLASVLATDEVLTITKIV